MNTKVVYVVSSDETDIYLEQALVSAYSVRKYNPDARIELVVDNTTDATITGSRTAILKYVDDKIVVDVPKVYSKKQTSRYLKTSLRDHISGDYLFLDTDTVVTADISEVDNFDIEVGAVIDNHVPVSQHDNNGSDEKKWASKVGWNCADEIPYFNSGVMYVKDCDVARKLYREWHSNWHWQMKQFKRPQDQAVLALSNERCGYLIQEIPPMWNCQILEYGLPYLHNAKIIHYFTSHGRYKYKPTMAYVFQKDELFWQIRKQEGIYHEIDEYIDSARHAFCNPTRVATGRELQLLSSDVAYICLHHPFLLPFFNFIAKPFVFGRKMAIKIWKKFK